MDASLFVIAAFAVLIIGLLLPLPSGWRSALVLALIALSVLTFIGGSMQWIASIFY